MKGYEMEGGVWIDPMPPQKERKVSIYYAGELAAPGHDPLYVYVNYSTPAAIEESRRIVMKQEDQGFIATFPIENRERIRFYFRSQNGDVDDNHGEGWESPIMDS